MRLRSKEFLITHFSFLITHFPFTLPTCHTSRAVKKHIERKVLTYKNKTIIFS